MEDTLESCSQTAVSAAWGKQGMQLSLITPDGAAEKLEPQFGRVITISLPFAKHQRKGKYEVSFLTSL